MNNIAIKLTNISKRYYLHPDKPTFIENLNIFKKSTEFWALDNVNITINKGEQVGIIGPNGAGKTTLLKVIANITRPTKGHVETHGKIVSLIEPSAGFQPEMNGIENIYLNSILLGMPKAQITSLLQSIIGFADIGGFINQPLYTYSEGMVLRLGMSVLIHQNADIFILDENLFVGDENFSKKIAQQIDTFIKNKKTIILSSHNIPYLKWLCNRTIQLSKGKVENIEKSQSKPK